MAERVVDLLQPVEVEHDDAEAGAGACAARDLASQVFVEGAVVPEPGEAVGERFLREARELLLAGALDPSPVADHPAGDDERGQQPEAEEERERGQLRELEPVGRPALRAAGEDGFGTPGAGDDGESHERHRERPESAAVEDGDALDGGEGDLDHCVGVGIERGLGPARRAVSACHAVKLGRLTQAGDFGSNSKGQRRGARLPAPLARSRVSAFEPLTGRRPRWTSPPGPLKWNVVPRPRASCLEAVRRVLGRPYVVERHAVAAASVDLEAAVVTPASMPAQRRREGHAA